MMILGLLLMGVAAAATVGVVLSSSDTVPVAVFGHSASSHEAGVVFVAGAIAGVVFALGLVMMTSGMARGRHRRKERRRVERQRTQEQRALRERNAELEQRLAAERAATGDSVDLAAAERERTYAEPGPGR